jgi:Collagen triple helix repeat (20 copies)
MSTASQRPAARKPAVLRTDPEMQQKVAALFAIALNCTSHAPTLFVCRVRQRGRAGCFAEALKHSASRLSNCKGFPMNRSMLMCALLAALSLGACDKPPTVVNVPAPVVVAGPAGPQGAAGDQGKPGAQGNQGNQGNDGTKGSQGSDGSTGSTGATGAAGKAGDGTTVIVMPPAASAPTN